MPDNHCATNRGDAVIRPVDAPVSQVFGENPTKGLPWDSWLIQTFGNYQPDGHSGQDYACNVGTPVRAVADGVVLHVGWMGGTYADNPWWVAPNFAGYCAVIDHGAFIGIYGHCKDGSATVRKGERVTEGQVFILSGNTGGSTGPHLHFEILPDQYALRSAFYGRIDPEPLFAGSLAYAGTITPLEEDVAFTAEQEQFIIKSLESLVNNVATKKDLPSRGQIDFTEAALRSLVENVATKADLSGVSAAVASAVGAKASPEEIEAAVKRGMSAGLTVTVKAGQE